MKDALINTKLHRPPVDGGYVYRPHLLAMLDNHHGKPLILVSAPAGYGKSTLISSWLEKYENPGAWLSLSESDSDLRTFISYFIATVHKHFPEACQNTQALLKTLDLPPLGDLGTSLLNELDRIKQPLILVLDDYYLIRGMAVHKLIAQILKHPPQFFHLVIVGRRDPPLPIASLRAQSQLIEIRTEDLCFSAAETETLLNQLLGIQIDASTVAALAKKTEGWVTGLRLAALSMQQRTDIDPKLLEPHVDAHFVMEYLFTEVFSEQPPDITRYLLGTAVLNRFCGPLCEAVCVPCAEPFACEMSGWEFITWLKKENLFLIPLDPEKQWFRYHHLFKKLLVNQLNRCSSTEEVKALHAQAGAWLAKNGIIEEAVQHYLAAEDIPAAMELVARHGHNLMDNQQWPDLERWIGMLPHDHAEQNPEILIFKAWYNHVQTCACDLPTKVALNKKIEAQINNLSEKALARETQINGHFYALRGLEFYLTADGENALKYFQSACNKIPMHHKRARVSAHLFLAVTYQMLGDLETGLSIYKNEIQKSVDQGSNYHGPYLEKLCFLYWIDADLVSIQQAAERSLKMAMDRRLPESFAFAIYFLGTISYHQNKLKIAEERLTQLVNDYYFLNVVMASHGSVALAMVYMAMGEFDQAEHYYKKALNYAIDTNNQEAIRIIQAFQAEYALRRGHIAKASQWAERFMSKPFTMPFLFYYPQLTLVRILMAQDTSDSRQQAADLLNQLNDFLTSVHYKQFQINVLALQAVHHDTLGEKSAALDKLTTALNLAEPSGFIRLFVELGPQMFGLLKQLVRQNVALDYIGQILAAFRDDERSIIPEAADQPITSDHQSLVEPLTDRELDVLDLLMQRLSNQEIAEKLFISTTTVKTHLQNIYGKLNVSKRREAVEKAKKVGIL
ncbi:MAG: winged helix-turn-helix transcriptional regulator [Desulfobacterales bacterium]|nr:winged helix-turn-helix transcriptional regulator [Desulfobacterales bacterium]